MTSMTFEVLTNRCPSGRGFFVGFYEMRNSCMIVLTILNFFYAHV